MIQYGVHETPCVKVPSSRQYFVLKLCSTLGLLEPLIEYGVDTVRKLVCVLEQHCHGDHISPSRAKRAPGSDTNDHLLHTSKSFYSGTQAQPARYPSTHALGNFVSAYMEYSRAQAKDRIVCSTCSWHTARFQRQ